MRPTNTLFTMIVNFRLSRLAGTFPVTALNNVDYRGDLVRSEAGGNRSMFPNRSNEAGVQEWDGLGVTVGSVSHRLTCDQLEEEEYDRGEICCILCGGR